jgi:hypothetical protein
LIFIFCRCGWRGIVGDFEHGAGAKDVVLTLKVIFIFKKPIFAQNNWL